MLASEVTSPPSDPPNHWAQPEHSPMPAKKATTKSATKSAKAKSAAKSTKAKSSKAATKAKKSASPKTRTASTKAKSKTASKAKTASEEVKIERRNKTDRRDETRDESVVAAATPAVERREKVQRRRQIDPTTCERDYSDGEVEFMNAMDEYKRTSGRMFPTCSEVLEVIRDLGYVQLTPAEMATVRPEPIEEASASDEVLGEDLEEAEMEAAEVAC